MDVLLREKLVLSCFRFSANLESKEFRSVVVTGAKVVVVVGSVGVLDKIGMGGLLAVLLSGTPSVLLGNFRFNFSFRSF